MKQFHNLRIVVVVDIDDSNPENFATVVKKHNRKMLGVSVDVANKKSVLNLKETEN